MLYAMTTRLAEIALRVRARLGGSAALRQRLVTDGLPRPAVLWLHGASVGELTSARPVIEALARDFPLIVTANSETGRDMAAGWGVPARLAPLDMPGALRRFLDSVQPRLAMTVESEFWPLRLQVLEERRIPYVVIGARMSERSAAKWARLQIVIRRMLGRVTALSAQDAQTEARLRRLGLPDDAILPRLDLKLLAPATLKAPEPSAERDRTVLAASTHEGEEVAILDGWAAARRSQPGLRLILAPRHPTRGDEIAALIAARGLPVLRRSQGATTGDLLLADTLGEMPLWYAQSGICLVGGSWSDRGGHTPWEPAAYRCAILHGPDVSNHPDSYAALAAAGAAEAITASGIGAAISRLAADPASARAMGQHGRDVLDQRAGDPAQLIGLIRDLAARSR